MPPCRAIAMAIRDSVTVSIGEDTSGRRSEIRRDSCVVVSTSDGTTSLSTGTSSTSSKVRPIASNIAGTPVLDWVNSAIESLPPHRGSSPDPSGTEASMVAAGFDVTDEHQARRAAQAVDVSEVTSTEAVAPSAAASEAGSEVAAEVVVESAGGAAVGSLAVPAGPTLTGAVEPPRCRPWCARCRPWP